MIFGRKLKNRTLNLSEDFYEHHNFGTELVRMIEGGAIFVCRTKRERGLKKNPDKKDIAQVLSQQASCANYFKQDCNVKYIQ